MAEAFGVVAGAAGLVSLLIQVNSGIDTLRDIRQQAHSAPTEVASITSELQFIAKLMEGVVERGPPSDASIMGHCQSSCTALVAKLDNMKNKFFDTPKKGPKRLMQQFNFRHWKEDVEALQRCIDTAKLSLVLYAEPPWTLNCSFKKLIGEYLG